MNQVKQIYFAKTVFDGFRVLENQYISVNHKHIVEIGHQQPGSKVEELDGILCPGFIDIQVNGGGGVLFNSAPTLQSLVTISNAHLHFGTTGFFATLISDQLSVMEQAAETVAVALEESIPTVLGIHYEGPHLSSEKKGIHPAVNLRSLSDKELALFCRKDTGQVIVTLAPECVPADIISDLVSQGVIVCLGHSNAEADCVDKALAAGATGFTHLYNAMSPLTSRNPGMVGAALADCDSYCGLIVDLHHVAAISCQVAIKAKSPEKIMLVTDAMAYLGKHQGVIDFGSTSIHHRDNKLTLTDGSLAGSALDMATAIKNCHEALKLPLETALKMATSTPAKFLEREAQIGLIAPGTVANMVLLDGNLAVTDRWLEGTKQVC